MLAINCVVLTTFKKVSQFKSEYMLGFEEFPKAIAKPVTDIKCFIHSFLNPILLKLSMQGILMLKDSMRVEVFLKHYPVL